MNKLKLNTDIKHISRAFFFSVIILLTASPLNAQSFEFAWLTDLHIGSPNAEEDLQRIVSDINKEGSAAFIIASGDISEQGRNSQLEAAKKILDKLSAKYYIVPGNHDTKWSESGGRKFSELWKADNFSFEHQGVTFIGLDSGIPWKGGGGHLSPEALRFLDEVLSKTDRSKPIVLVLHHPLDAEVDNWFEAANLLNGRSIKGVLVGHGHVNKLLQFNGLPGAMGRSALSRNAPAGYTSVVVTPDSMTFFEVLPDSLRRFRGSVMPADNYSLIVDSAQFINYSAEVLWNKELGGTLVTPPVSDGERVFAALRDGRVICLEASGKKLWEYNTGGTILSRPDVYENILVVATAEGDMMTINAATGKLMETIGLGEPVTSQLLIIDYTGTKTLMSGSKSFKAVIAGTSSGMMYCYDLYTFELLWQNEEAKGMIETRPLEAANKIIFGAWDGFLYCLDARSGVTIWKWSENKNFYYSPAACTPVTDGKYVYVATPDKYVAAIDLNLGKTIWRKNDFQAWESIGISEDKSRLFIKGYSDRFFVASASTGKKISEINIGYGIDTMPVTPIEVDGQAVFGLKNGTIVSVSLGSSTGSAGTSAKGAKARGTNKALSTDYRRLMFTGTSRTLSVVKAGDILIASNMDGRLTAFRIK